jgi:GT2 family glycosyltransferase/ubiquinone/menaquinone biosynthesis C-methylase UbiE
MEFTGERYVPSISGAIRYEHLHRYGFALQLARDKRVLDIASGEGYGAAMLAREAATVKGVDISAESVRTAQSNYYRHNLEFLVGSCEAIPLPDESVDLVTSFETIEHHDKHDEMMGEIKRVLCPGGLLIISSPNRYTYSDEPQYSNPFHVKELYYDELVSLLRRYFKHFQILGQRLATGSFLYSLDENSGRLTPLTGSGDRVSETTCKLESPIYFVALCSDYELISPADSLFLDPEDDLFKASQIEFGNLVQHTKDQEYHIAEIRSGYEAQIHSQSTAWEKDRKFYEDRIAEIEFEETQLEQKHSEVVSELSGLLNETRERKVGAGRGAATKLAHEAELEEIIARQQSDLARYSEGLENRDQVLGWIYSSRAWRTASKLRRWQESARQLRQSLLPGGARFTGHVESVAQGDDGRLELRGWASSSNGRIVLAEVFAGDFYLGPLKLSTEQGKSRSDFSGLLEIPTSAAGQERITVRVFDNKGNSAQFACLDKDSSLTVPAAMSAATLTESDLRPPISTTVKRSELSGNDRIDAGVSERISSEINNIVGEFQRRTASVPAILWWGTEVELPPELSFLHVFYPPGNNKNVELPYIDDSVDIVLVAGDDPARLAEARRVARRAVITTGSKSIGDVLTKSRAMDSANLLKCEWKSLENDSLKEPTVSIIIPVYNKLEYTEACLQQLHETLPATFEGEIIVVDDCSSDETPLVLKSLSKQDKRLRILRNEQNLGFIRSSNRGAGEAKGEMLIFLNNDTLPQSGWLQPLLDVFQAHPNVGAVGGKLVFPNGILQEAGGVIFSDASGCNFGKFDKQIDAPLYSFLREVDYCSGALLATPKALFQELGGFDTRYVPAYYEDADYCFTLRNNGYKVFYQPESVVVHFEGISSGTDLSTGVKSYQAVNREKFAAKWAGVLKNQPQAPDRYDFPTFLRLSVSRAHPIQND